MGWYKKLRRCVLPCFVFLMYLFLYIPIIVLIVFSFNKNQFSYGWQGLTLKWYYELFSSVEVWDALKNSLIVATLSVFLTLLLGILFVCFTARRYLSRFLPLFYVILAVPEIVLAVGMLSFFSLNVIPLGLTTLVTGHTLIGLGYVVPILYNRFISLDYLLIEASLDLGATRVQTFFWVVLPLLSPSLIAAGLLVFIVSLDDFVFSFFCSGASMQTLPLYIFSLIRSGATPVVNALSTLLLIVSALLVLLFSFLSVKKAGEVR